MSRKPSTVLKSLRTNILVGALLIAPVVVTWEIIDFLLGLFTEEVVKLLPAVLKVGYWRYATRVIALVLVLVLLFLIGVLVRNLFGRRLYALGDRLLRRVPGVNLVYRFIRQVIEVFFANPDSSFQEAVLLEYPRPGVWSLGFVTSTVPPAFALPLPGTAPSEMVCVFIPTMPNPTSGWFCIVPRTSVTKLAMAPGDAMKLVISGGAVFPGKAEHAKGDTLMRKVDQLIAEEEAGVAPPADTASR